MNWSAVELFALPVIVGLAAGYATGGRLRGLIATRLRALWLVWLAAAAQVAQYSTSRVADPLGRGLRVLLLGTVFVMVLVWLVLNLRGRGRVVRASALAAVTGGSLNGLAIALNGRMPYSPTAAAKAGLTPGVGTAKNVAADGSSRLSFLGDVIPVPPLHAVISAGDVLIALGAAVLVAGTMHQPAQHPAPPLRQTEEVT